MKKMGSCGGKGMKGTSEGMSKAGMPKKGGAYDVVVPKMKGKSKKK